jgi:hypothetical protein
VGRRRQDFDVAVAIGDGGVGAGEAYGGVLGGFGGAVSAEAAIFAEQTSDPGLRSLTLGHLSGARSRDFVGVCD